VRAAIVGCGFQGRLHLAGLQRIPGVEVVALSDRDAARLDELGDAGGVPREARHADWRALLDAHAGALDLLTVCTMPDTHRDVAVAALDAGVHVLCEKPLARTGDEGAAMVAAARRARRLLSVGFNMRHTGAAGSVRRFVDEGRLGRPVCARGFMLADDVPWWGRHYVKAVSGGGALAATAVHMLDLLIWLTGDPVPVTASASATRVFPRKRRAGAPSAEAAAAHDVEDLLFGHVRFDDGFWLSIEGAWVWDRPGWNYGFELVGDRGQASFDPLTLVEERMGELTRVWEDSAADTGFPESVERELEDVVAAVRDGRPPLVTGEQALKVQLLVDALYRSAAERREVPVTSVEDALAAVPGGSF
jgi:predicted dehydrogenase